MKKRIDIDKKSYEDRCNKNREIALEREKKKRARSCTNVHQEAPEATNSNSNSNSRSSKEDLENIETETETEIYSFEEFKKINRDTKEDSLNNDMIKCLEMMCELWYEIKEKPKPLYKWFIRLLDNYIWKTSQGRYNRVDFNEQVFKRYTYHREKKTKIKDYKKSLSTRFSNFIRYKKQNDWHKRDRQGTVWKGDSWR